MCITDKIDINKIREIKEQNICSSSRLYKLKTSTTYNIKRNIFLRWNENIRELLHSVVGYQQYNPIWKDFTSGVRSLLTILTGTKHQDQMKF